MFDTMLHDSNGFAPSASSHSLSFSHAEASGITPTQELLALHNKRMN